MKYKKTLAIETSCDDTSVAIVQADGYVIQLLSANQNKAHEAFGGVVPEIASRNHTHQLIPLIDSVLSHAKSSWDEIDVISVTSRPGLIGALLVGVVTAKSLSLATEKPFYGVNHLEGHILAPFLKDKEYTPPSDFGFPYIALAVSGGHTQLYYVEKEGDYQIMGRTQDDAAGEAFDKFGKSIGLGFPGGVAVDRMSQKGKSDFVDFPRPLIHEDSYDFSFSGLKSAGQRYIQQHDENFIAENIHHICASYQQAIVDSLMSKLERARKLTGLKYFTITGGVSANSLVRKMGQEWAEEHNVTLAIPPIRYCTDNAAMIGYAGLKRLNSGVEPSAHDLAPRPRPEPGDFSQYDFG